MDVRPEAKPPLLVNYEPTLISKTAAPAAAEKREREKGWLAEAD